VGGLDTASTVTVRRKTPVGKEEDVPRAPGLKGRKEEGQDNLTSSTHRFKYDLEKKRGRSKDTIKRGRDPEQGDIFSKRKR